jgi:hypothetical protein
MNSALISASVGSKSTIGISLIDSHCHVSHFVEIDAGDALCRTASVDRSCKLDGTRPRCAKLTCQVFYGRYLRKLSNLTQEAVGEMSKVGLFSPDAQAQADQ